MATKKIAGWKKKLTVVLAIVLGILFVLSLDGPAQMIAEKGNFELEKVKSIVKTMLMVIFGLFLIMVGLPALTVPIVGMALIAIGLGLIVFALWPLFKKEPDAVDVEP